MKNLINLQLSVYLIVLIIFLLSLFYKRISRFLNLYDLPDTKRKKHILPTSMINGFLILVALNLYFLFDILFYKFFSLKFCCIAILSNTFFYILGYYDDLKDLSPKKKSFLIILFLLLLIPFDQNLVIKSLLFENITNKEIILNQSSIFLTIFFIYIFYNFMNFIDGLNGIAISVSLFFIIVLGIERDFFLDLEILIIICLFYCLYLNIRNKSFLGNSGVSLLGVFISTFFIREYNLNQTLLCDQIFIIFFIPGIDMTRLVFSRILNGKSISQGDLNHLHHYLLRVSDKKFVFILYILITMFPYLSTKFIDNNLIIILVSFFIYIIILIFLTRLPKKI